MFLISSASRLSSTGTRYLLCAKGLNGSSFVQLNTVFIFFDWRKTSSRELLKFPSQRPGKISSALLPYGKLIL